MNIKNFNALLNIAGEELRPHAGANYVRKTLADYLRSRVKYPYDLFTVAQMLLVGKRQLSKGGLVGGDIFVLSFSQPRNALIILLDFHENL